MNDPTPDAKGISKGKTSAILLAAGLSSRFGKTKQLADLEGVALAKRALATLERSLVDEIIIVVGYRAADVGGELQGTTAKVVVNEGYRAGLASSLRAGLAALDGESRAVVVCLADQPFITVELIDRIVSTHRRTGADVVASVSEGLVSPPVLFSRAIYGEIAGLRGDKGAKSVIQKHPDFERVLVEPEIVLDVDTEEDLSRARKILKDDAVRRAGKGRAADGP